MSPPDDRPPPLPRQLESWVRLAGQLFGGGLLLVGAYYLLLLLQQFVRFVLAPGELDAAVAATGTVIGADKMSWTFGADRIEVGKAAAAGVYAVFCVAAVWVAGKFIALGGRLTLGAMSERQEMYAAVKEMARLARDQGNAGSNSGGS